ncbi:MAG TPA: HAMP domain-containing sensor histidine kinase [Gemmataceae bacterium]|jgi:two-component system heavy metal sensor histidine kinase CusS|nr:HAMP domain-containing sensor histidine kinase [Gemmataceae bacterium]
MLFGRLKSIVQTLRFRLTAWVALVVFLVVSVTMLSVREVVLRTIRTEFDQRLQTDLVDVRQAVKDYYPEKVVQFQKNMNLKGLGHLHVDWFVQLFDAQGNVLWQTANAPKLKPPQMTLADMKLRDEDAFRLLETRSEDANASSLIVRLGSTRLSMEDDIGLLNRIMLLATVSILVLAPVSAYFLAGRATRPLNWIISTTARLEPKNLNERLPIRGTGDELDQLSVTINGMLDRIGIYLESNRDFIANAAHELRSPLTAIRGSVDVALDRLRAPEEYAVLLTDVAEECARLTSLVNRLLLLAEGDAGRLAAHDQCARLDKVVSESVNMFEAVAESKGVELKLVNLSPAVVPGEEFHLRQVVRNLLDNAIKFTPARGRITVDLATDPDKKQTALRVSDSGIGIASADMPRIFERFYQSDKSRNRDQNRGGSGLGLAICLAIVSALHGKIEVQSQPSQGSVFTVTLPLVS